MKDINKKTGEKEDVETRSTAQNTGHALPLFESSLFINFHCFSVCQNNNYPIKKTKVHIEKEVVCRWSFCFCFVFFERGELACCVAVLFPGFWFVSFFSFLFSSLFFLLSSVFCFHFFFPFSFLVSTNGELLSSVGPSPKVCFSSFSSFSFF